jgi:hypothetical protein
MTLEHYAHSLGAIVANLQSLEFTLRGVLQNLPTARTLGIPPGTDIYAVPVRSELPESEMTSYDSLGELIDKYNTLARDNGLSEIDRGIVDLRDALAHGRVSAAVPSADLRLLKFSKPKNGKVTVTFNALLSEDWFSEQRRITGEAVKSVIQAH